MQLLEKTVDLRGSQVLNARTYQSILCQRRMMALCTLLCWFSVIVLIVAIAIPQWEIIKFTNHDWEIVNIELGVWGEWRSTSNTSRPITEWIPHFPSPPDHMLRLAAADLKHYYRAQAAIGVIALCILICTNCVALYTFYHHRYMYKRLTACLYFIVGMCIVATVEVLSNSVDEWNTQVAQASMLGDWDYDAVKEAGLSKYLAMTVVTVTIVSAMVFFCGSRKQKGDNAATAEFEIEDRPIHMGRL